jgi:hypothetical protein
MKWNSYVIRLTGTFIGLIVGLLIWYIGGWFSRLYPLAQLEGFSFREWEFPWKCVRDRRKRRYLRCASHVHPAFRPSAVPPGCCSHGSMWWSFPVRCLNPSCPPVYGCPHRRILLGRWPPASHLQCWIWLGGRLEALDPSHDRYVVSKCSVLFPPTRSQVALRLLL